MKRTGGCACGNIRFEVEEPFLGVGACHCADCQKASGGGANYVALVPTEALKVLAGEPRFYHCLGGSGSPVRRAFCGDCGTPLWSHPSHDPFLPVKLGAFDDMAGLAPQMQIYVASAQPWHWIDPALPTFEKMPPAVKR